MSQGSSVRLRWVLRVAVALLIGGVLYVVTRSGAGVVTLTGVVTTDEVVVAPQIAGQVAQLLVREGDSVGKGALIAVIAPAELAADSAYYAHSAKGYASEVSGSAAALRMEERQSVEQIRQAEAMLAAAEAERAAAAAAEEDARLTYERLKPLTDSGAAARQELDHARTGFEGATARLAGLDRQVAAQQAALALARASAEQISVRRSTLGTVQQQRAAAEAQQALDAARGTQDQRRNAVFAATGARVRRLPLTPAVVAAAGIRER